MGFFSAAALALLVCRVTAQTTVTATSTGDFDDPYFMGYWIKSDEGTPTPYETVRITAHTPWVTSGTYAGDCDEFDEPCLLATACTTSGSVLELLSANDLSSECGFEQKCYTMTIFASSPEGRPTAYNVACREEDWSMDTLYQISPTSSSAGNPEDTTRPDVGRNRSYVNRSSGLSTTIMIIVIVASVLIGCSVLACGIIFFRSRKKRKIVEQERSEIEITTFAYSRGYVPGNAAVVPPDTAASESTLADTRNATVGETVPSTVDFRPEQASQSGGGDATGNSSAPAPDNHSRYM